MVGLKGGVEGLMSLINAKETSGLGFNFTTQSICGILILHLGFGSFVDTVHFYRHGILKALPVIPKLAKVHFPNLCIAENCLLRY